MNTVFFVNNYYIFCIIYCFEDIAGESSKKERTKKIKNKGGLRTAKNRRIYEHKNRRERTGCFFVNKYYIFV